MIRELRIGRFGRFVDRRFSLSAATLFIGDNESGKTTLFDVFLQEICRPAGSVKRGIQLKERYGAARSAELVCDGDPPSFDVEEFTSLCAIRSGDISLEMASGRSWMDRVKSRLFTGGLDPGKLRDEFADLASTKGSLAHNKELKRLEGKLVQLRQELDGLQEQRRAILGQEKEAGDRQKDLAAREEERRRLAEEVRRLEEQRALLRQAAEKKELNDLLSRLREGEERSRRLEELAAYPPEGIRAFDAVEAEYREARRELDLAEQDGRSRQAAVRRREAAALEQEQASDRMGLAARAAADLLTRVEGVRQESARRPAGRWNRGFLALFLLAVVVGIGMAALFEDPVLRFGFPAAVILLGAVPLLLSRRPRTGTAAEESGAVRRLQDEWRARAAGLLPDAAELRAETLDGLVVGLQGARARADEATRALLRLKEETAREREALVGLEAGLQARRLRADELQARREEWLRLHRVADRDAYLRKSTQLGTLREEQARWEEELRGQLAHRGCAGAAELKRDVERRLNELDREGAPDGGAPDAELRRLESDLGRRRARLDGVQAEIAAQKSRLDKEEGRLTGSLGKLPEQIAVAERAALETAARIRELQLDREAAELARRIFEAIAQDSESLLQELGRELARQFAEIVRHGGEVEVPALDQSTFRITDGGGEKRSLEQLSQGTHDAFVLAARLALARKAVEREGVLILDEPFHALDRKRVELALRLIARFQRETGWQVILLSKDEGLVDLATEILPDLLVNRLSI